MKPEAIIQELKRQRVLAILRLARSEQVQPAVDKLAVAGIKALEVTSNTPDFLKHISEARSSYPELLVGAGTVVNPELAEAAMDAGAQFLVTPNVNTKVIRTANDRAIPILPGAMTPTEIFAALDAGADAIKLFPAYPLGLAHYKAIKAVLDKVAVFAVGGIHFDNAREWIEAGVAGVGLGSSLTTYLSETDPETAKVRIGQFLHDLRS